MEGFGPRHASPESNAGYCEAKKFVKMGSASSPEVAVMVNDATNATNIFSVMGETVTIAAGAAGTTGTTCVDKAPIYNALGTHIGCKADTSISWTTGTCLTTEEVWDYTKTDAQQIAALAANGCYRVDYRTGRIVYKKATAATSDTISYKTRQTNIEVTSTASVTIGAVTITGCPTPFADTSVNNAAQTMKATAGTLYSLTVQNPNAAEAWLQVFNVAAPTIGVTAPNFSFWIPGNGAFDMPVTAQGVAFSTAITYAATTTATGGVATVSPLTLNAAYL